MATGFGSTLVGGTHSNQQGYAYRNRMGLVPSAEFAVFFDDFGQLLTTNVPAGWSAAVIDTGATLVSDTTTTHNTSLIFDSDGATEGVSIYLPKNITITAGKKFFMEMRFKTEIADDSDVQFGLSDLTATTNPEDLWTTTAASLIAFGVLDGSAVTGILMDSANSGTSVEAGTISLVSATWHTLAIAYNGSTVSGYVDGKRSVTSASTVPTATLLAPFVGFRNGSAATTEGHIDYFRYSFAR